MPTFAQSDPLNNVRELELSVDRLAYACVDARRLVDEAEEQLPEQHRGATTHGDIGVTQAILWLVLFFGVYLIDAVLFMSAYEYIILLLGGAGQDFTEFGRYALPFAILFFEVFFLSYPRHLAEERARQEVRYRVSATVLKVLGFVLGIVPPFLSGWTAYQAGLDAITIAVIVVLSMVFHFGMILEGYRVADALVYLVSRFRIRNQRTRYKDSGLAMIREFFAARDFCNIQGISGRPRVSIRAYMVLVWFGYRQLAPTEIAYEVFTQAGVRPSERPAPARPIETEPISPVVVPPATNGAGRVPVGLAASGRTEPLGGVAVTGGNPVSPAENQEPADSYEDASLELASTLQATPIGTLGTVTKTIPADGTGEVILENGDRLPAKTRKGDTLKFRTPVSVIASGIGYIEVVRDLS